MSDFAKNLMAGIYANSPDLQRVDKELKEKRARKDRTDNRSADQIYIHQQFSQVQNVDDRYHLKIRGGNSTETKWITITEEEFIAIFDVLKKR